MKKDKTERLLPSGKYTTSIPRFRREWTRLSKPVAKLLNCTVLGYDPGILFSSNEGSHTFTLTPKQAQIIRELIIQNDIIQKALYNIGTK